MKKVFISIDGQKPVEFTLSKFDSNIPTLDIPISSDVSKIITLDFDPPEAIRPKDIGGGLDDKRLISIGLVSVKFD